MSTRDRRDEEFAREIDAHLELEAEALMREGLDPETARDKARAAFGNVTLARERFYERQRWPWLDHLRQDVRAAFRAMRRYPIAALVAILSLGFGIGAAAITLTVRDVVFRKAPPLYRDPARISRVHFGTPGTVLARAGARVPAGLYTTWASAFEGDARSNGIVMASALPQTTREVLTASPDTDTASNTRTETLPIHAVTPSLFNVLGVEPSIGRVFTDAIAGGIETTPAVLSYRVWQQLFDGRPDVAGQMFWIDNQPFAVTGVMPEQFYVTHMNSPIWIPLDIRRVATEDTLDVFVRRPAGTTPAQLDAFLRPGLDQYARQLPAGQRRVLIAVSGIEGTPLGHQVSIVIPYLFAASVVLTLLIACANVAVLMIAQWTAREHEVAIRAAIGASRGRIVRALLTESIVIAIAGGLVGIAAALALRGIIIRNGGAAIAFYDLSLDPAVFVKTALIAILTGIVAGLAPALYETRRLHGNPLRAMGVADRVRQRWRHALVVFEITVTIALLVQTSALIDSYRRAMSADLGFRTAPLSIARVENSAGVQVTPLIETVRALPGVDAAAVSTSIPFGARGASVRVSSFSGRDTGSEEISVEHGQITPSFFSTLGVPLRAGRSFADGEPSTLRTAIVNETLATRLFGGDKRRALGATILIANTPHDIVGIVADYANHALQLHVETPRVFTPLPPTLPSRAVVLIRGQATVALVRTLRGELRDAPAGNVVTGAVTMDEIIDVMGQEMLAATAPLAPLISISVLLTAAGIYGVLAFAVARRGRELAVRVAMGASRRELVRLVTMHSLRLVGAGVCLGLGVTFILARVLRASGGAGSVFDPMPISFIVPAILIAALGIAAAWLPARRASAIDPVVLLRNS